MTPQHSTSHAYLNHSERLLDDIVEQYLSHPSNVATQQELDQWRPRYTLWNGVQAMARLLPNLSVRQSRVDGHKLCYWEVGQADRPTVVLVHGFGASKDNWLRLIPRLARYYHLLIPDLPGFGESSFHSRARYTYQRQAQRLAEWYRSLELKPAHWVGSSMGGAICAVLAANHADQVASVCLMNAAGVAGATQSPMMNGLLEGQNALIPGSASEVSRLFQLTTHRHQQLWARVMPPLLSKAMIHRHSVHRHIFRDMLTPEIPMPRVLQQVHSPTLIMWGDQDKILDVSCAEVFKALIPHAELKVYRDIGHLPMLEAPRLTARGLNRFWRGLSKH